ncbi:transposase family protein [Streptomyces cinereoruber]|uniref:transposase family protein n=1 Tax=Streptomyces cinereoruber TaxID=67260 RepID=UPI003C2AE0A8
MKACQGAGHPVRVRFRGHRLKRWQRRHNSTHAKIHRLGEQVMATQKCWRLLRKLRYSANRVIAIVRAVLVLHHASARGRKKLTPDQRKSRISVELICGNGIEDD